LNQVELESRASPAVTQGPGCTGVGGLPAFADQGKLPLTSNAEAEVVENMSVIAVVNKSWRRLTPGENGDFASRRISTATMAFFDPRERRSPTSIVRADPETAALKIEAYLKMWQAAAPL
jgi:hypothetical protein